MNSFVFEKYKIETTENNTTLKFFYSLDSKHQFVSTLLFCDSSNALDPRITLALGIVEGFNYWKLTAPEKFIVSAGYLSPEQLDWWQTVLLRGMGEYFYTNKIDFTKPGFISFECRATKPDPKSPIIKPRPQQENIKTLVPVGGGKDSLVMLELLKKSGRTIGIIRLDANTITNRLLEQIRSKYPEIPQHTIERTLDPKLLELSKQKEYYNGHVPFTIFTSFLSMLVADLDGYNEIAFANERSAEEENVQYMGQKINHQWAKSLEAENMLREYIAKFLAEGPNYYSGLRPLYELQIMGIFADLTDYHPFFSSCNVPQKEVNRNNPDVKPWCGKCAKCLFAYALLYPFLGKEKAVALFGHDLFGDESLVPLMRGLIGNQIKPFECVGTAKESLAAFYLSLSQAKKEQVISPLLQQFEEEVKASGHTVEELQKFSDEILHSFGNAENLPKDVALIVREAADNIKLKS